MKIGKYGWPIPRPKEEILIRAGYRKVPNHSYSNLQVDEQWISNCDGLKSRMPRFHIIKDGKKWFLHYDYMRGEQEVCVLRGYLIKQEAKRLQYVWKT